MIELIQGDCLTEMQKIQSGSVDAIITDPPYGTTACKWDSVIPFEPMWEQLNRVIKPNGAIVLFGSEPFSSALRMSNIKNYKYDWKWLKSRTTGFQMARKRPMKDYEDILVFYSKQPTYFNTGLVKLDKPINSWRKNGKGGNGLNEVKTQKNRKQEYTNFNRQTLKFNNEHNVGKNVHPTQKPVALMEYLIKTYTNENELVLDFTMGSGTTGVACKNLNRSFIGIEQDPEYFKIAQERINKLDLFS
jgi:site-specific DNA-methyltransferase (adenine-specific)|tara:strand:- start:52 stop:789 length:738 start_codon:yes stop_codon:yes gene_type:complete